MSTVEPPAASSSLHDRPAPAVLRNDSFAPSMSGVAASRKTRDRVTYRQLFKAPGVAGCKQPLWLNMGILQKKCAHFLAVGQNVMNDIKHLFSTSGL